MRIELRIDRLVLDGVGIGAHRAAVVREAVEVELSRLLVASPANGWQRSRRLRRVGGPDVGGPDIAPSGIAPAGLARSGAAGLGAGIARSVYGAVRRAD